jgi:hypothetical protein
MFTTKKSILSNQLENPFGQIISQDIGSYDSVITDRKCRYTTQKHSQAKSRSRIPIPPHRSWRTALLLGDNRSHAPGAGQLEDQAQSQRAEKKT